MPCRSYSAHCFSMSMQGGVASTSVVGKGKKGGRPKEGVGRTCLKKPTKLLFEQEFRKCFLISNGISILLIDDDPVPTEKESLKCHCF